jgi:phenylacetate-CoA ligase
LAQAALKVGELLARRSTLEFYFDDYLTSLRFVNHLSRRERCFVNSAGAGGPRYAVHRTAARLLAYVKKGGLRRIEAYQGLEGVRHFQDLPFTTKSDLRSRGARWLSPAVTAGQGWVKNTTGTTGSPISVVYDAGFYFELSLLLLIKIAARAGLLESLGQRPVFCVALNDKKATGGMVVADPRGRVGPSVQVHVDERKQESFCSAAELIREWEPECVTSKPSVLEQLSHQFPDAARRGGRPPIFVASSGSMLFPQVRDKIRSAFAAPVLDAYTMTEFGLIASECTAAELHIDTTSVYVEVVDDDGNIAPAGETGELVITGLRNRAMPLLRYRTGDFGGISRERCACGAPGTCIVRLSGKKIVCFHLADGSRFSPTYFNDLFGRFPSLSEFQITQESPFSYSVTLDFQPQASPNQEMERIREYIRCSLPGDPHVRIECGLLPKGGKFQRYRTEM